MSRSDNSLTLPQAALPGDARVLGEGSYDGFKGYRVTLDGKTYFVAENEYGLIPKWTTEQTTINDALIKKDRTLYDDLKAKLIAAVQTYKMRHEDGEVESSRSKVA